MGLFRLTVVFPFRINKYLIILITSSLLTNCNPKGKTEATLPFYNSADFTAEWISEIHANYSKIHTIAPFALHNQLGHLITEDSLKGQIYVANFFFSSCPSICPKMMTHLKTLQETFTNEPHLKLVSFSVMPWVDSVATLKQYGEERNINPAQWHLLTGKKEDIYSLARQSYFAEKTLGQLKSNGEFLHTESMLLIDKKARIRGIYNATQKIDIERITDDINILLKE